MADKQSTSSEIKFPFSLCPSSKTLHSRREQKPPRTLSSQATHSPFYKLAWCFATSTSLAFFPMYCIRFHTPLNADTKATLKTTKQTIGAREGPFQVRWPLYFNYPIFAPKHWFTKTQLLCSTRLLQLLHLYLIALRHWRTPPAKATTRTDCTTVSFLSPLLLLR